MSTNTFEEIYFCPDTFEVFFNTPKKDKGTFLFSYRFDSLFYRVNEVLLTCCFYCHAIVVKNHIGQVTCFVKYFLEKEGHLL